MRMTPLLLLCATLACGDAGILSTPGRDQADEVATLYTDAPPPAPTIAANQAKAPEGAPPNIDQQPTQPDAEPMIIRTGQAFIQVDSLEPAIAAIRSLAERVGGYVANTSIQGGERRLRTASLELKIPAARWSDALQGLDPIGELQSITENAQDVGEEFVDVNARLTNARRLETRLTELLDKRTGKLEEVLGVERELARVREEIERYEGRLRYLRSRVAVSTLVVSLQEPAPIVSPPGENIIVNAFEQAWTNFVRLIALLIAASGVVIPLALLGIAAVLLARRLPLGWLRPGKSE